MRLSCLIIGTTLHFGRYALLDLSVFEAERRDIKGIFKT